MRPSVTDLPGRVLVASLLHVMVVPGVAASQSILVTRVSPGTTVELVVNRASVGTATAGAERMVRLVLPLAAQVGKPEIAARLFVDTCPKAIRIVVAERGAQELPAGECTRREVVGVYLVREVTTLLVSLSDPVPTVRIRQGPAPPAWLVSEAQGGTIIPRAVRAPAGLLLGGGGHLAAFRNFGSTHCGDVSDCTAKGTRPAYAAVLSVWPWRFLGASAAYIRPSRFAADGSGGTYRFTARLDAHLLAITATVGAPVGRARLFGQGGAVYHRARATISQTIDSVIQPADPATPIEAGTELFQTDTAGWGWIVGGGLELWLSPRVALLAGLDRAAVRGDAVDGSEAKLAEGVILVTVGLRLRLGG